jgi:hypothetical protein
MKASTSLRSLAGLFAAGLARASAATEAGAIAALPMRRDAAVAPEWSLWLPLLVVLALSALALGYVVWQKGFAAVVGGLVRGKGAARTPLVRLSSQALTPQASVHVLHWQGDEFLLACTGQQVVLLARKGATTAAGTAP